MKPHKHAELIKLWADGAEIEFWNGFAWQEARIPRWDDEGLYRIKPEPRGDVVKYCYANNSDKNYSFLLDEVEFINDANLKLTFDGETGELKSAEVLK